MPTDREPTFAFRWSPAPYGCGWDFDLTVTMTEPRVRTPDKVTVTPYCVEELPAPPGQRRFHFAKAAHYAGDRAAEVYETVLFDGGSRCSCKGAVCRLQAIACRHVLSVLDLIYGGGLDEPEGIDPAAVPAEEYDAAFPEQGPPEDESLPDCFRDIGYYGPKAGVPF